MTGICLSSNSRQLLSAIVERDKERKRKEDKKKKLEKGSKKERKREDKA